MKTLILILTILVTLNVNPQSNYKLYSNVWLFDKNNKNASVQPADGSVYFRGDYVDSILKLVNLNKVKSHLLKSFNEFRNDYGKSPVLEDLNLTVNCESYSKKLEVDYRHDNIKEGAECISKFPLFTLTSIKLCNGDFNKQVSECIFDIFVKSDPHMSILLSDDYTKYGFGVYINKQYVYIVIRGIN